MIGIKPVLWALCGAHGHLQTYQPNILRFNFAYKIHAYIIYILYYILERVFVRTSSPRPSPAGRYINIIYLNLNRFLQIFSPDFFGLNFYGKILTIYYKLGKIFPILKFQKKFVKSFDFTNCILAENFQYFNIENFLDKKKNPTRFSAGGVLLYQTLADFPRKGFVCRVSPADFNFLIKSEQLFIRKSIKLFHRDLPSHHFAALCSIP